MDKKNWTGLLEDLSKLDKVKFEDIITMLDQYPFDPNLRLLAAKKAQMINHPSFKFLLESAAAYATDRNWLYERMHHSEVENKVVLQKQSKEKAEKEKIKKEKKTKEKSTDKKKKNKKEVKKSKAILKRKDEKELKSEVKDMKSPSEKPKKQELQVEKSKLTKEESKAKIIDIHEAGISDFSIWLNSLQPIIREKEDPKKELKPNQKRKDKKKIKIEELSEPLIISEPLADLLAEQGHLDKAKEMYEQLGLLNPSKSTYFAAKIKNLKKKI